MSSRTTRPTPNQPASQRSTWVHERFDRFRRTPLRNALIVPPLPTPLGPLLPMRTQPCLTHTLRSPIVLRRAASVAVSHSAIRAAIGTVGATGCDTGSSRASRARRCARCNRRLRRPSRHVWIHKIRPEVGELLGGWGGWWWRAAQVTQAGHADVHLGKGLRSGRRLGDGGIPPASTGRATEVSTLPCPRSLRRRNDGQ